MFCVNFGRSAGRMGLETCWNLDTSRTDDPENYLFLEVNMTETAPVKNVNYQCGNKT